MAKVFAKPNMEGKKMLDEPRVNSEIQGRKTLTLLTALFLVLTIAATLVAFPLAHAHTPAWNVKTYAFLSVEPNPIGVGQTVFVNFWLDKAPPTANGAYGDRWQNYTVKVTKPDGTVETLGPFRSDAVGGAWATYTPTQLGNYTFVFSFPGQTVAAGPVPPSGVISNAQCVGDYYEPSTSETVTLLVQQQQVQPYPSTPLPTDYWQRPIFAMNTAWYTISGNWLGTGLTARMQSYYNASGNFNPYTRAPETSHILWTKPYAPGGLIGGQYGGDEMRSNYYSTAQYEPKFGPPIIINGVLYWNLVPGASTNQGGWMAVDLHTGKTLWTINTTETLRMGQILDYVSPNQYGGLAYLWTESSTTPRKYSMYDAMTGNYILSIVNVSISSPAGYFGPYIIFCEGQDGSLLGYYINSTSMTLNMWNSTRAIFKGPQGTGDLANAWLWRPPQGAQIPFEYGIQWSMPLVTKMTASNGSTVDINEAYHESSGTTSNNLNLAAYSADDVLLVTTLQGPSTAFQQPGYIIAEGYNATTGQLLWGPLNLTQTPWSRLSLGAVGQGIWAVYTHATRSWTAYSLKTGQKVWGPVQGPTDAWGYYEIWAGIAYGALYTCGFSGIVNAYNVTNGALLWSWSPGSSGYETPYGIWPLLHIEAIADGKIYIQGGHEYSPPLFHGSKLWCLDAASGKPLWSSYSFAISNYANAAIADGILVVPNAYDNQVYAYGKGPTATTVSVQNDVITKGSTVLIKGTVTDQSPGQTCLGIPAAGTPAVSDDSMDAWMAYLYQQQPKPANATGVLVRLAAIDQSGTVINIGETTSTANGNYAIAWTPPAEGQYWIEAFFDGSRSYYSSHAETALYVTAAAPSPITSTPPPSTSPPTSPSISPTVPPAVSAPGIDIYMIAAATAVVAVIIVAAIILKRKQK